MCLCVCVAGGGGGGRLGSIHQIPKGAKSPERARSLAWLILRTPPSFLVNENNSIGTVCLTLTTDTCWGRAGDRGAWLTLVCCEQRRNGALVPHGDKQRPGQHDEDDCKDVPSFRHLQGWLGPQLLVT